MYVVLSTFVPRVNIGTSCEYHVYVVSKLRSVSALPCRARPRPHHTRPDCANATSVRCQVSFEERVAGRKDEIEALKEAYKILDDHSAGQ